MAAAILVKEGLKGSALEVTTGLSSHLEGPDAKRVQISAAPTIKPDPAQGQRLRHSGPAPRL